MKIAARKPISLPQPDLVLSGLVAILAGLSIVDSAQVPVSLVFVGGAVLNIAPFFLLSIALTAYVTASGADNLIASAFTGNSKVMIPFAALMGALSPFCSCGVIPVITALLVMRVPLAPVMAFWLASPLMDPAQFILTAGVLGTPFAIAKTIAAIGVGLLGGFGTAALVSFDAFARPLRDGVGNGGCASSKVRNPKGVVWQIWQEPARVENALRSFIKTLTFLGKMLVLAFALESLMVAYLPTGTVSRFLGGTGLGAILNATLIGIPAYLNGTVAMPLVRELIAQGMSPGAGMAFLVGGGVTSIPAALAVWAIARPPVFAAYLGFSFLGALLSGAVYQVIAG
jgi:uncharacterized protein